MSLGLPVGGGGFRWPYIVCQSQGRAVILKSNRIFDGCGWIVWLLWLWVIKIVLRRLFAGVWLGCGWAIDFEMVWLVFLMKQQGWGAIGLVAWCLCVMVLCLWDFGVT